MAKNSHFVFVYGSLKMGFGNHALLQDPSVGVVGEAETVDSTWWMLSLGSFPGVVKLPPKYLARSHGYKIVGELYEVSNEILENQLDRLEGNGYFYTREQVKVEIGDEAPVLAWMYVLTSSWSIRRGLRSLEEGDTARVGVDETTRKMTWLQGSSSWEFTSYEDSRF